MAHSNFMAFLKNWPPISDGHHSLHAVTVIELIKANFKFLIAGRKHVV